MNNTLKITNKVKNKFFDEFFKSIKFNIPDEIIKNILSYFNLDDNILVSFEEKYIINYYDHIITIGKIKSFWYSDYNFQNIHKVNDYENKHFVPVKWDIFQTCYNCNYCKPIHHNYSSYDCEFPYGFILKKNIYNNFSYLCNDCYCTLF